jgi:glyoxylase-like metal-dependent hydrolase (beta-lactamase superfamily II)
MVTALPLPPTMRVFERGWLSSNNVLLFDDRHSATLVDTGYVAHNAQTLELVRHALGGRRLTRIVNTHLHSDHCGGNALLKREFGAAILIPPGHADAVRTWDDEVLTYAATGQRCDRFMYDALIVPGETLRMGSRDWQALAAPGHDPNSVVLWDPEDRILIAADALWQHGFGAIFPEIEGESGFAEQRAMLAQIARLAPRLVIPGHGATFTDVDEALARAANRLEALAASPERNARQVAKALIKFYLLEVREIEFDALVDHLQDARYFRLINERYFKLPFEDFIRRSVAELASAGAVELSDGRVVNRDD